MDLWYQKRPLYQLSHNHCPSSPIYGMKGIRVGGNSRQKHKIKTERLALTNLLSVYLIKVSMICTYCCVLFLKVQLLTLGQVALLVKGQAKCQLKVLAVVRLECLSNERTEYWRSIQLQFCMILWKQINSEKERERERERERAREEKQILIILKTFAENDYVRSKVILTLNSFPNTQISNLPTVEKTRIVPRYNVALKLQQVRKLNCPLSKLERYVRKKLFVQGLWYS